MRSRLSQAIKPEHQVRPEDMQSALRAVFLEKDWAREWHLTEQQAEDWIFTTSEDIWKACRFRLCLLLCNPSEDIWETCRRTYMYMCVRLCLLLCNLSLARNAVLLCMHTFVGFRVRAALRHVDQAFLKLSDRCAPIQCGIRIKAHMFAQYASSVDLMPHQLS